MKKAIIAVAALSTLASAEINAKLGTYAAFQGQTRKNYDGNLELGYVRAELYSTVTSDNGVGAFVRVRAQNLNPSGARGISSGDDFQIVNAMFTITPKNDYLNFQVGRWEETYKEQALYFGRYALQNPGQTGSGSFLTQEVSMDAAKVFTKFGKNLKNNIQVGILAKGGQDKDTTRSNFNDLNLMVSWSGNALKDRLRLDVFGNFAIARQDGNIDKSSQSAVAFNGEWDILENVKGLSLRGELGLTNLADVSNNTWGTFGISLPTGGVLDMLAADFEIHKNRVNGSWLDETNKGTEFNSNLGWFVQVAKVFKETVRWDIGFGVDPSGDGVGSQDKSDIGVISRIGFRF